MEGGLAVQKEDRSVESRIIGDQMIARGSSPEKQ